MALPRFYIEPSQWDPAAPALTGPEGHHARDVLRVRPGEKVVLFDGAGRELTAEVAEVARQKVQLLPLQASEAPRPATPITLAQAIPKGKNMDGIVQKAVELGAAEIVPILSDRTVVSLDRKEGTAKQAKWRQIAIEACKQCGQNWLPEVRKPASLKDFLSDKCNSNTLLTGEGKKQPALRLIASTRGASLHLKEVLRRFESKHGARPGEAIVLIGPEGDFTAAEYEAARAAEFQAITLGKIILRVETAAIYCLSVLSYELMPPES